MTTRETLTKEYVKFCSDNTFQQDLTPEDLIAYDMLNTSQLIWIIEWMTWWNIAT